MPTKPPSSPPETVPVRLRLVVGWGAFFVFVVAGIILLWRVGGSVPVLIDGVTR